MKGTIKFELDIEKGLAVIQPPNQPQPIQPFTSLFTMEYLGATRLNQPKAGVTLCP